MSTWCLIKSEAEKFKKALKNGEIKPQELASMSSSARREFLSKFVGEENARQVNALFESKLLLKNQKAGMISWAKSVSGISPKIQRDLVAKIERLDRVLSPSDETAFLEDLASTRLGLDVSYEEAREISSLSGKVSEAKKAYDTVAVSKMTQKEGVEMMASAEKNKLRSEYGDAVIALDNFVTGLKQEAGSISIRDFKKNPLGVVMQGVKTSLDLSKSMKASYDDSAILNQGFPILANYRTARIWARNAGTTFVDMVKTFGGKPVWDKVRADVVSRPNYLNGLYKKQGLAVNVVEESFPTSLPEKAATATSKNPFVNLLLTPVRLFGKGYKATEIAFNAFQLRNRVDVFDLFAAIAEKRGLTVSNESGDIEGLGKFVNALTSRGRMGALEPVANIVNSPFFSLRKQVAAVESLAFYQLGKQSTFTRKLGAESAIQQLLFISTVLGVAYAVMKDSVELDSTSSDFGKIRIGNARFDITQGRAAYLVLASRILQNKMKSSTSGKISDINTGKYGALKATDLIGDFTQNKFSPLLNNIIYIINRSDREGKVPTVGSVLADLYVPLSFEDIPTMLDNPNSANYVAATIANFSGIQSNAYPNANIKSQMIPEGSTITNDSFIHAVEVYAKALGTDPETAFNRVFTGQRIRYVTNGTIVVERMPVTESEKLKDKQGGKNKYMKLDHTIPLELGGSNDESNLKLVTTSEWSSYTPVENALGKALRDGRINKKEAQDLIVAFKKGTLDKQAVLNRIK